MPGPAGDRGGDGGTAGRLFVGTSGFSYPAWAPRFYLSGLPASGFLRAYADRLSACELNSTFYRHPTERTIARWLAATPETFRFTVKAQRGGSLRALLRDASVAAGWLTEPYRAFRERLGSVLFRVPDGVPRDDDRLAALLGAWPDDLPLTIEAQDPSWAVDETFAALEKAGAAWCSTDRDDTEPPPIRALTGWLYLRLRRASYGAAELATWADRLIPFLDAGQDAYVFFRHDADGISAVRATEFTALVADRRAEQDGAARRGG